MALDDDNCGRMDGPGYPGDGSSYVNEEIHLIRMRWGKVVYLRAYLYTAVLIGTCGGLVAHGISEALAAPIED